MDLLTECRSCWPEGTQLIALPAARPRVVIPVADGRKMFASAGFFPASRPAARVYRGLLRLRVLIGGGLQKLPATGGTYSDVLDDVEISLGVGARDAVLLNSAGQKQSLTVRHADETGAPSAFTKVGVSDTSRALAANESAVLKYLDGRNAPKLLVQADSHPVTQGMVCMEAVRGRPLAYNSDCPDDLTAGLIHTSEPQSIDTHPWIRAKFDGWDAAFAAPLMELAAHEPCWPVCVSHGDAAPWNALRSPDGSIWLIDWEYGSLAGLGTLDRAHWTAQVDHLIHRRTPKVAARRCATSVASSEGIDLAASAGACGLMALDVKSRHSDRAVVRWWFEFARACIALGGDAR